MRVLRTFSNERHAVLIAARLPHNIVIFPIIGPPLSIRLHRSSIGACAAITEVLLCVMCILCWAHRRLPYCISSISINRCASCLRPWVYAFCSPTVGAICLASVFRCGRRGSISVLVWRTWLHSRERARFGSVAEQCSRECFKTRWASIRPISCTAKSKLFAVWPLLVRNVAFIRNCKQH